LKNNKWRLLVSMLLLFSMLSPAVLADSGTDDTVSTDKIIVYSSADSWVQGGSNSTTNYGDNEKMKVKRTSTENRDAFVKFTVPMMDRVQSVTFSVYVVSMESATIGYGGVYNIEVRGMEDTDWAESELTYDQAPDDASDRVLGQITVTQADIDHYVSLDVTDYVKERIGETISFRLRGVEQSRGADYATREHPYDVAPKLDIVLGESDAGSESDTREQIVLDDTYTRKDQGPFGDATRMNVKSNSSLTDVRRAYLKFAIPEAEGLLEKAEVKLFVDALEGSTPDEGYDVTLFGIEDDSWNEMTLTHDNRPVDEGTPLHTVRVNADTVGSYIRFDVTEFVKSQEDEIASFYIQSTLGVSRGAYFRTKEHSDHTPPILTLTFREYAVPAVPENLSGDGENKRVVLTWDAAEHAEAYEVERTAEVDGTFVKIAEVTGTGYVDTDVENDVRYYYRVRGINSGYTGDYSDVIEATPRYPLQLTANFRDLNRNSIEQFNGVRYVHSHLEIRNITESVYDVAIRAELRSIRPSSSETDTAMNTEVLKTIGAYDIKTVEFGFSIPEYGDDHEYILRISVQDVSMEEGETLSYTLNFPAD